MLGQICSWTIIPLFVKVAEYSQQIESDVLKEVDKYIDKRGRKSGRNEDLLIPALCMRRLALHYRRMMKREMIFSWRK